MDACICWLVVAAKKSKYCRLALPFSTIFVVAFVFVLLTYGFSLRLLFRIKACRSAALSSVGVNFFGERPQLPLSLCPS